MPPASRHGLEFIPMTDDRPRFEKLRHNQLPKKSYGYDHAPVQGMNAGRPAVPQPKHSTERLNQAHHKRRRRFR